MILRAAKPLNFEFVTRTQSPTKTAFKPLTGVFERLKTLLANSGSLSPSISGGDGLLRETAGFPPVQNVG